MNHKLEFAKRACHLLEDTTDHIALRKLCSYLLEEMEKLSHTANEYGKLLVTNDHLKNAQQILEQELINYKLKFEEISKKMDEHGYIKSDSVRRFENPKGVIEGNFPPEKLNHMGNDTHFVSLKQKAQQFADLLKIDLVSFLDDQSNKSYIKDFNKYKLNIQRLVTEIMKRNPLCLKEGKKIDNIIDESIGFYFEHLLPENGIDSILSFTRKKDKNKVNFSLVPQTVVEKMLTIGENKNVTSLILKEIKDIVSNSVIKVGVKKYWLLPIAQEISMIQDKFLKN